MYYKIRFTSAGEHLFTLKQPDNLSVGEVQEWATAYAVAHEAKLELSTPVLFVITLPDGSPA